MKRPIFISIIAWLLIVSLCISLIVIIGSHNDTMAIKQMEKSSLPIPLQYTMQYLIPLICLIAGIAMLKGKNWAEFFYVIFVGIGLIIGIVTSPIVAMIPGLVFFAVITFFLFRPRANDFFNNKISEMEIIPTWKPVVNQHVNPKNAKVNNTPKYTKANDNKPIREKEPSDFAKHFGSGVCDVCNRSISPGDAYLVPVDIFFGS